MLKRTRHLSKFSVAEPSKLTLPRKSKLLSTYKPAVLGCMASTTSLSVSSSLRAFSSSLSPLPRTRLRQFRPSSPFSLTLSRVSSPYSTFKKIACRATSSSSVAMATGKNVQVYDTEDELAVNLAKYVADLSDKFGKERGSFSVVLSGGSLIKSLRKLLAPPYIDSVEWSKWHILWVDERVVPKDHDDSNYKLAFDGFISKVPIVPGNVYAINDALSAEGAAEDYETCLKHLININVIAKPASSAFPKFDLMLLGMGPDGHVASLFPGHPLVNEKEKWVTHIEDSPKPPPQRITFTLPVINSSSYIALVVTGAEKAGAVQKALGSNNTDSDSLPVELVKPEGELTWFLDKHAASKL